MFILGLECVTQLLRGKLLAQNVFYDPLLLDVGKPLCDESGDISPGDFNHRKQQEDFGNMDFRILFTPGYFPKLWFCVNHAKLSHVTQSVKCDV